MVMTDVSNSKDRANALGKLGVSYGVGMVVGPTVGGYVTTLKSEQFAAGVAAGLCLVTMVIIIAFVPAHTKTPQKLVIETKHNKKHGQYMLPGKRTSVIVFFCCCRLWQCV